MSLTTPDVRPTLATTPADPVPADPVPGAAVSAPDRAATRAPSRRLAWLDALRGIAALVVVFEHSLDALFPEVRTAVSPAFDFGKYGVLVFFLVSGYVVPASLERGGSVRAFWIGRLFRIYPLWALVGLVAAGFGLAKVFWGLPGPLTEHPWLSALAHLTMLQDLLGVPNVLNAFWTLSYEMAFYLLLTAMFAAGVRRPGAGTALGLAVAALVLGGGFALVSTGALGASLRSAAGWDGVILAVCLILAIGLAAVLTGRRWTRRCGAALLAIPVFGLLIGNSRIGGWQSLLILATMFAGTAVHRLEQTAGQPAGQPGGRARGRSGRWWAEVVAVGLVPVLSIAAAVLLYPRTGAGLTAAELSAAQLGWSTATAAAWLTFALGLAVRHRRLPRVLPWLGMISYSVYLLHQLPLQVLRRLAGDPAGRSLTERSGLAVVLLAVVLGLSALTYRFVERPMQGLGRRIARSRVAAATAPTPAPGPTAPKYSRSAGTSRSLGIVLAPVGSGCSNTARK